MTGLGADHQTDWTNIHFAGTIRCSGNGFRYHAITPRPSPAACPLEWRTAARARDLPVQSPRENRESLFGRCFCETKDGSIEEVS